MPALARLYIERGDFDTAYDRLLKGKQLGERINIAGGLGHSVERDVPTSNLSKLQPKQTSNVLLLLAGDLSAISVFDTIQVIENAKLTGMLTINGTSNEGYVMFNDGRIVDAECGDESADVGFQNVVEIASGTFEFQRTSDPFPVRIQALSNTNLLLDTLRMLDERKQ